MQDGTIVKGSDGREYMAVGGKLVAVEASPAKAKAKAKAHVATVSTFKPIEGVYKGKATLQLAGFPHPFTFGVTRAKLILSNLDAIRSFAAKNAE